MDLPDTPPDSKFNSRFRRFTALLGLEPVLDGRSRGALPDPNPDDAHIARAAPSAVFKEWSSQKAESELRSRENGSASKAERAARKHDAGRLRVLRIAIGMLITLPHAALRLEPRDRAVGTTHGAFGSHAVSAVGLRRFGKPMRLRDVSVGDRLGGGWYVFEASSDDETTGGGGGGGPTQKAVTYTEEALVEGDVQEGPENQGLMEKIGEFMGDSWDTAVKNNPIPVITKKMRKPGETAAYVRAQGSSLFGIAEGLGLQYRMGAYTQVDDDLLDEDPGLNQLLVSTGSSISQLFTQDMWERHRGVSRYWRHLATITKSTVFNRIVEPVLLIATWAAFWCLWNGHLVPVVQAFGEATLEASNGVAIMERLAGVAGGVKFTHAIAVLAAAAAPVSVPATAHSLAGTALGLVLVFRTNGSSARLNEARVLLGNMVRVVRDLVRLLQYVPDDRRCEGVKKRLVGYAASVGKFFVILVRAISI